MNQQKMVMQKNNISAITVTKKTLLTVAFLAGLSVGLSFSMPALAATNNLSGNAVDWNPVASEKLIRMPAKYMDASIERHFQQSPLASGINALGAQIQLEVTRMQESYQALENDGLETVEGETSEQAVALRHHFLTAKSNYLELMHEKHQLYERALNKKAALYQRVLNKLQQQKNKANDPVSAALIVKQNAARARLSESVIQVDQLLAQTLPGQPSKYQQEYSENLAKVAQLKQSIQQHGANDSPVLDGQSLNREQYVRYLLSNADSELALLDQERLMLGYMAKLVALDAQALEHEMAYGSPDIAASDVKEQVRLANTADLFMNP